MGLLKSLKLKFSKDGEKPPVECNTNAETQKGAIGEEEHVDYTCPTLKDVSVRAGGLEPAGGAGVVGGVPDGGVPDGGVADGGVAGGGGAVSLSSSPPSIGAVGGSRTGGEAAVAGGGHNGYHDHHHHHADMRSEMDTLSIGSASELASEDFELHMSNAHSGLAKREQVARLLGEIDREAAQVGGSMRKLERVVKKYNDLAVACMEGSSLDQSLECLVKAEGLLDEKKGEGEERVEDTADSTQRLVIDRLLSITYNNLGCLYRRMAEPEKALEYLKKALAIEQASNDPKVNELASTHLNLSASYSVLHKDVEALRHGERAILLLQGQLWPGMSFKDGMEVLVGKIGGPAGAKSPELMRDAHVLSMAYHNVGTQNERLGRIREAQVSFNRACSIGTKILGPADRTTVTLQMNNRMFLQRNGGVSKGAGLQRTRSGVGLSSKTSSGKAAPAALHSRQKSKGSKK